MIFLKFKLYSGISYIRINPENQLLRQPDVIMTSAGQRGTVQVKPDEWEPLVSDPLTFSVTDKWVRPLTELV